MLLNKEFRDGNSTRSRGRSRGELGLKRKRAGRGEQRVRKGYGSREKKGYWSGTGINGIVRKWDETDWLTDYVSFLGHSVTLLTPTNFFRLPNLLVLCSIIAH